MTTHGFLPRRSRLHSPPPPEPVHGKDLRLTRTTSQAARCTPAYGRTRTSPSVCPPVCSRLSTSYPIRTCDSWSEHFPASPRQCHHALNINNCYSNINLGKYGTFSSNKILGRPYYLTYELLDKDDGTAGTELRVVPASELHAEALGDDHATPAEAREEGAPVEGGLGFDIVGEDGEVIVRNNRLTIDDTSRQTLSMEEIEELKRAGAGSGKEIIAKILSSHLALAEKTSFSLAKYTLRKSRKYLKRFTALPLDMGTLIEYIAEKEAYRIMELREETLGLICSWADVHNGADCRILTAEDGVSQIGGGRWLVVDDTGGLVTAALAEKMGILYSEEEDEDETSEAKEDDPTEIYSQSEGRITANQAENRSTEARETDSIAMSNLDAETNGNGNVAAEANATGAALQNEATASQPPNATDPAPTPEAQPRPPNRFYQNITQMSAQTNSLTVLHPNNQPNLSHLKYFGYDTGNPPSTHPLFTHLKQVSWLQLLCPSEDPSYIEPEVLADDVLATMKSSKRGNYYKKRRRWEKTKRVVDEARRGGFDGLVVASVMEPKTILKEAVPLVRGGGRVVVYSPNAEPLVELCDYYSKERRAAFIAREFGSPSNGNITKVQDDDEETDGTEKVGEGGEEDFPVNPTLLLAPSLQTVRARHWQVLPERTHPFMTSKGGAEGYLFTATRVLPVEGKVEARGHGRGKKRKTGPESSAQV